MCPGLWQRDSTVQRQLEEIYRDHRQGLYTLALAITRCPESAEDAVQDACTRLWRSTIEPTGDCVAYVFASVRNAALEIARRGRDTIEPSASIYGDRRAEPPALAIAAERHDMARRAVDGLESQQREVVVLRLYGGLTFQQIADTLDEPLPTVASRYRRALERIRDNIGESL